MSYYALIKAGIVENVVRMDSMQTSATVIDLAGRKCEPGWLWNGSVFSAPPVPPEATNQAALEQQMDAAIAANMQTIAAINNWLTTSPGAGTAPLTAAQLSPIVRQLATEAKVSAQQRDAIIRLLRGKFDATT